MDSSCTEPVRFHEVALRDGLQNESVCLSPEKRAELASCIALYGPSTLEVAAFVHPRKVPQMAGAEALCQLLLDAPWRENLPLFGLVPNQKGFDVFVRAGLDGITLLASASEGHSQANVGQSQGVAFQEALTLVNQAQSGGFLIRAYVSMAFGCPFDGEAPASVVIEMAQGFFEAGADVVVLADTVGGATPQQIEQLVRKVLLACPGIPLGLHLHDGRQQACEGAGSTRELGVVHFDSALGGLGGCPFAPGAAGNMDTAKWADFLRARQEPLSLNLPAISDAAAALSRALSTISG